MNVTEILALVQAGYTKEEIAAMSTPAPAPAPTPAPAPAPAPAPTPAPAPAPTPAPAPAPTPAPAPAPTPAPAPAPTPAPAVTLESLAHQMAQLTSAIQANAIAQSSLTPPAQPTAEDALAQIIRPTFKERGA